MHRRLRQRTIIGLLLSFALTAFASTTVGASEKISPLAFLCVHQGIFDSQEKLDAWRPGHLRTNFRWYWEDAEYYHRLDTMMERNKDTPFTMSVLNYNRDLPHSPSGFPIEDFDTMLTKIGPFSLAQKGRIQYYIFGTEINMHLDVYANEDEPGPNVPERISRYVQRLGQFYDVVHANDPDAVIALDFSHLVPKAIAIMEEVEAVRPGMVGAVAIHNHRQWTKADQLIDTINELKDTLNSPQLSSFNGAAILINENSTYLDDPAPETTTTGTTDLPPQTEAQQAVFFLKTILSALTVDQVEHVVGGLFEDRLAGRAIEDENDFLHKFTLNALFYHPRKVYSDGYHAGPKMSAYVYQLISSVLEGLDVSDVTKPASGVVNVHKIKIRQRSRAYALWLSKNGDIGSSATTYDLSVGAGVEEALVITGIPHDLQESERRWPVTNDELLDFFPHEYRPVQNGILTLNLENHTPVIVLTNKKSAVSVTPNKGEGREVNFEAVYRHRVDNGDISAGEMLINTSKDLTNSCFVRYEPDTGLFRLKNDSNSDWVTSTFVNGQELLDNTQCQVNITQSSAQLPVGEHTLSVHWSIKFKNATTIENDTFMRTEADGALTPWVQRGTWTVRDTYLPLNDVVIRRWGHGQAAQFETRYYHGEGSQNFEDALLLIHNTSSDVEDAVLLKYDHLDGKVYLRNDDDDDWIGGHVPGDSLAPNVSNSQVLLEVGNTSVIEEEHRLIVRWSLRFDPDFTGDRFIYLQSSDSAYTTPWEARGNWYVHSAAPGQQAYDPVIGKVQPDTGSSVANNEQSFTSVYFDLAGVNQIKLAHFRVGDDGRSAMYYNTNQNKVYLKNNDGSWSAGVTPGIPSTPPLFNDWVELNVAEMTVSKAADRLAITWPLTFLEGLAGSYETQQKLKTQSQVTIDWTSRGAWTVLANQATSPSSGELTPSSGSRAAGTEVFFVSTHTDLNGADDIDKAYLQVNGNNSSLVRYHQGKVWLWIDNLTGWSAGVVPGTATILSNPAVDVDVSKVRVTLTDDTLEVRWPLTFKADFAGSYTTFLKTEDASGLIDNWGAEGTWTVTP